MHYYCPILTRSGKGKEVVELQRMPKAFFTMIPPPQWPKLELEVNGDVPTQAYLEEVIDRLAAKADKHNIFVDFAVRQEDGVYTVTLQFDRVTVYDDRVRFLAFQVVRFLVAETRARMTA